MSAPTTAIAAPATCTGCDRQFKGARGLAAHQNHRNAAAACKSIPTFGPLPAEPVAVDTEAAEAAATITSPAQFSSTIFGILNGGGILASARAAALVEDAEAEAEMIARHEARGGEGNPDPREFHDPIPADDEVDPMDDLAMMQAGQVAELEERMREEMGDSGCGGCDNGEPCGAGCNDEVDVAAQRDEMFKSARKFWVKTETPTLLVKMSNVAGDSHRLHRDDALALRSTADNVVVAKVTVHENGDTTTFTDSIWSDGVTARMSERVAK